MNKSNFIGFLVIGFLITILLSRNQNTTLTPQQNKSNENIVSDLNKNDNVDKKTDLTSVESKDIIKKIRSDRNSSVYSCDNNEEIFLENNDIKVYFSKVGACIQRVILKNYKDFTGENVELLCKSNILNFNLSDYNLNTAELRFENYIINSKSVEFNFTADDKNISIIYEINDSNNFEIKQYIKSGSVIYNFIFDDILKRQEISLEDCKNRTTINYFDGSSVSDINGYKS